VNLNITIALKKYKGDKRLLHVSSTLHNMNISSYRCCLVLCSDTCCNNDVSDAMFKIREDYEFRLNGLQARSRYFWQCLSGIVKTYEMIK